MESNTPPSSERSALMARIRGRNTYPEMFVRRLLHKQGYRFRLHAQNLPGRPDMVFRGRRKVIFIHGCFWHHHKGCKKATIPKTRTSFWKEKFESNRKRDTASVLALEEMGWKVMVVWECEIMGQTSDDLLRKLVVFLDEE